MKRSGGQCEFYVCLLLFPFLMLSPLFWTNNNLKDTHFHSDPNTVPPILPCPPLLPGFLHTPDGGHPSPTLSRHSPPVFSALGAEYWYGSPHSPGTHSHSAGKANGRRPWRNPCTCILILPLTRPFLYCPTSLHASAVFPLHPCHMFLWE